MGKRLGARERRLDEREQELSRLSERVTGYAVRRSKAGLVFEAAGVDAAPKERLQLHDEVLVEAKDDRGRVIKRYEIFGPVRAMAAAGEIGRAWLEAAEAFALGAKLAAAAGFPKPKFEKAVDGGKSDRELAVLRAAELVKWHDRLVAALGGRRSLLWHVADAAIVREHSLRATGAELAQVWGDAFGDPRAVKGALMAALSVIARE